MVSIGKRIKKRREILGLSQEELAKRTGYKSRSSINKIEMDGRNLPQKKIMEIATALNTTPSHIMGWDESFEHVIIDLEDYVKANKFNNELLAKFKELDEFGRDRVITILINEFERCQNKKE